MTHRSEIRPHIAGAAVALLALVFGLLGGSASGAQSGDALATVESSLRAWTTADARAALEKIYDAGNAEHLLAMGELLTQEGKLEEAKQKLQRATELAPADPEPWLHLGETFARQGNREQADNAYRKAAELARERIAADGAKAEPHLWLGAALVGQRQADAAAEHLQHARDRDGGDVRAVYYLGLARSLQQRWKEAVDLFSSAIEKAPRYAYAYYYRGLGNSRIDRKGDMLADLENFVFLAPEVPEAENARKLIRAAKK
jgi:tetratricopeptide (TPR) repeat protein